MAYRGQPQPSRWQSIAQGTYGIYDLPQYNGPYPTYMLENARHVLIDDVNKINSVARRRVWEKCGIYDNGERDDTISGWADASDQFSWSRFRLHVDHHTLPHSIPSATVTSADMTASSDAGRSDMVDETVGVNVEPMIESEIVHGDSVIVSIELDSSTVGQAIAEAVENPSSETADSNAVVSSPSSPTEPRATSPIPSSSTQPRLPSVSPVLIHSLSTDSRSTSDSPILIEDTEPTLQIDGVEIFVPKKRKPEIITIEDSPASKKKYISSIAQTEVSFTCTTEVTELLQDPHVIVVGKDTMECSPMEASPTMEEGEITDNDDSPDVLNETTHIDSLFVIDRQPSSDVNADTRPAMNGPSTSKDDCHVQNIGCASISKRLVYGGSDDKDTNKGSNQVCLYKCDFCPTISASKVTMEDHLKTKLHYTASLVIVDSNRKPYSCKERKLLTCMPAKYKTVIAVCPSENCPLVFPDIYCCMIHYTVYHSANDESVYAIADVIKEESLVVSYKDKICRQCEYVSSKASKLHKHMTDKRHFNFEDVQGTQIRYLCIYCHRSQSSFSHAMIHLHGFHHKDCGMIRLLYVSNLRRKKTGLPLERPSDFNHNDVIIADIKTLKELKEFSCDKPAKKRINKRIKMLKSMIWH